MGGHEAEIGTTGGRTRLVAHRGGAYEADENTIGAFRYCWDNGLRAYETDVRMTRDDHLVILHDDTLDRTTTGTGPVEALTADEVRSLRMRKSGETVPFLADLIAFFRNRSGFFLEIEMKTGKGYPDDRLSRYCRKLHRAVTDAFPNDAFTLSSFDARPLRLMKEIDPAVTTTLISGNAPDRALIDEARGLGCTRIDVVMDKTTRQFVGEAKEAGFEVTGWPTRSEEDLALGQALGFDLLTTDIPVRLLKTGTVKP